jgi:pimeloyl-ACP methyl ester carboxylesterase
MTFQKFHVKDLTIQDCFFHFGFRYLNELTYWRSGICKDWLCKHAPFIHFLKEIIIMKSLRMVKSFWFVIFLLTFLSVQFVWAESWQFSSSLDGWTGRNCFIKHASDGNGRLYMYPEGSDPGIVRSVSLSASSNNILKMYIWTYCPNKTLKLYFRSNGGSVKSGPSISLNGGQSGKEYSIDLRNTSSWTGTITEIRIDPTDSCGTSGNSGFIGFDYIKTDFQVVYGSISGGVRDYYTEAPLGNVAVRLEINSVIKYGPIYTASNGTYKINNVLPGTYRLVGLKSEYDNTFLDGKQIKGNQELTGQNLRMKPTKPELTGFSIDNGASTTKDRNVSLKLSKNNNATHYRASESSSFSGASWKSFTSSPGFQVSSGFGNKKLYCQLKNDAGSSNTRNASISYVPTPQVSDSKTTMRVNETISLYCDLGSEGANRKVTFYVDPGSASLKTYAVDANSSGRAEKVLTADNSWIEKTYFACQDYNTGEVSGYDASVNVTQNRGPNVSISLKKSKIAHGWHVPVTVSSDDPDGDDISCKYKINAGDLINTINQGTFTIAPPNYTFIIGSNTITVECTDIYGEKGSDAKTLVDYAVPDQPPYSLSPDQDTIEAKASYEFVFGGFPDPSPDQKFHYRVIIDDNNDFSSPVYDEEEPGSPFDVGSNTLLPDKTYYWKIRAENSDVIQGPWAESWFNIVSPTALVSVSGRIYSNDNSPVVNALVRLEHKGNIIYPGIYSDEDGAFSFPDVEPGDYDIVCLASSYINQLESISVTADHSVQQDIFLVPTEINWKIESQQIEETVGTVLIEAVLNGPTVDNVIVSYLVSGSASGAFIDHGIADSNFEIKAGDTVFSKTFPIIDDEDEESEETIILSLESPVNAVKGLKSTHTVVILPSDPVETEPDTPPYFSFSIIDSTQIVGKAFDVVISAYDSSGNIMDYSGDVFVWASHSQNINPGKVYLNQGMWMDKMTIYEPGSNIVLQADRNEISGKSNSFSVIAMDDDDVTEIPNNSGRIEGIISNGSLIGKMSVHLTKEKNGLDIYSTETETGYYSIENIECGTYYIYGSYGVYGENTSVPYRVNIPCGRTVTKDLSEDLFISFCNQGNNVPILLVPGIMGSSDTKNIYPTLPKYAPQWNSRELTLFDPFNAVGWQDLKKLLIQKYGYKLNCTLFDVPYDWRLDINESSQKYLEKWIDYAKKQSGSNKVNIVAHSMGGLLARSYIQSDSYKNDVARLAMVGTPNHGAALAYYLWEGGDPDTADKITSESDSADQISGFISRHLHFYLLTANLLHYTLCGDQLVSFQFKSNLNMNKLSPVQEAKLVFTQKAARNAWHMIHNFVPSIRQLLPTYEGALSFSGNDMNILKCQNVFLTNLNFDTDISRMVPYQIEQSTYDNDKVITKIFVGTNNRTVQSINVNDPPESSDFYTPKKIHELCYAPPKELSSDLHSGYDMFYPDGIPDGNPVRSMNGDGTVLMDSVNIISENQSIAYNPNELKDAAHSGLIKAYANEIASFITQENDWDFRKRQKLTSESNISDADPMTALSIGIIGRAQPYIINSNSLGCGIHYQNLNREDDIPESSVEIQTDSGNIMIESPEAGMYTVFIRGIYEEDYYLFLTYHAENFTDTLTFHAFNQAETTHFTFNIDAKGLTINQAMDITLAVSSQAAGSDSKKTKLVWEVSEDRNVASYNIYAKKSGHPYYSKIANTQEKFFLTEDQWAENDEIENIYYAVSAVDDKGNMSFLSPFVLNSIESSSENNPVIIEPSVQNVRSDQGVVIFNVDNLSNLNWEAKTNTQWLSINSNSNLISVSYESNSAEARTGFITVTINENPVSTIILEINQDRSPEFYNSLPLKKNDWQNITSGNWYETEEGIKFDGISYRSYSKIQSKDVYNFEDSQLFVKWKSTSKSYARYYVRLFGVVSTHSFTTHHSYGSSMKIDTNNWYYTRIKITSDNSYEVSTCKEDYDINGGSVINKASGELSENASMHLKKTYICFEQYDAYDSTNASMIIGEVKTNAIPVDIKSNKVVRYDFEDMTEVPSIFNHSGEWVIDNSGYNSSQSLYLFANESKSITIDATDIAYISFRVKFSAKSYYDSSGFNYGAPYIPLINQWSNKLTFAIPENATQLSWVYREDTKWSGQSTGSSLWIDDIEIGYFKTDSPLHFQPTWTGHPIDSMKIWLISDSFENLNLSAGDEIAVYDNNTCVGATIIQSTDENNLNVLTSRADDDDPGFIEGHNISFRVWDSSEQLEYSNIAGEFFNLNGDVTDSLFKSNADSAVKLFISTVEQTFQLNSGWNMVSFNVIPELNDLSEIFKPLMDANSLVKVIDEKGQRLIFNAFSNQWENEIGEMSNEDGYLIKVNNDVEWTVEGEPVKNPFQVTLVSGWNIFGWPMKNPQEAMNVIQPLIDNNSLIKIIDEQGRRFIYNAFSEEWIDEIITFEPNKGYLIKLTQDALLTFDEIDPQTRKRVSTHRNVQSVDSVIFENFEGATVGKPSGITFAPTPNGQGAVFTRENESRVEYPFAMGLPRQGTIEFLINVHHGYHYSKYELTDNKTSAVIFDAGGQDVWWPGGMWFNVSDSGNVSLYTATAWAQGKGHNLNASDTGFKFNEWHAIGFSFGSQGQHIMVDGKIVASNEDYTETLEGCGNFDAPVNPLTLGELESCFWGKNQYDRGFDGIVDSFRASDKQMDWVIAKNETLPTDTHFQPVWSGHPIDSMKIWILQESFETLSLSPGDEIAIFDGDICVGSTIIESTSDQTLNILTSRKDDDDPGFEQGHKILFRTWDASEKIEFKNITGEFFLLSNTPTDNTFKPNADVAVSLYISTVERTFHLKSGWNIISFNIMPEQADLISIFQ